MKRLAVILIVLIIVGCGLYFLDHYWIHRYDSVIAREAARYHVDPDLVWSIAYEETYFSPWKKGRNGEIGLMQVTPAVAREWAGDNAIASTTPSTAIDQANLELSSSGLIVARSRRAATMLVASPARTIERTG